MIREEMCCEAVLVGEREPRDFFVKAICLLFVLLSAACGKVGAVGLIFLSLLRLNSHD